MERGMEREREEEEGGGLGGWMLLDRQQLLVS